MQKGLLTGKITKERVQNLPPDDHRTRDSMFQDPQLGHILELVNKLKPIAERNQKTLAQLAIAWVLRRPEVTSAIVGTRKPEQIEDTVLAGDWVLSPKDIQEIDSLLAEYQKKNQK